MSPDWVKATRNLAPRKSPISAAARATAPPWVRGLLRSVSGGQALGEDVLLGGLDDAAHGLHGLDGVLADAGLAGEHDRVGAVHDGVGDVGGLGAGGAGVVDHRVEHLGGDDDRLGVALGTA